MLCVSLSTPSGQPVLEVVVPDVSVAQIVTEIIPQIRQMTGVTAPLMFKTRQASQEQIEALQQAQANSQNPGA